MPCDVQRLLDRRFRQQGEDVARDAIVKWLDPTWPAEDIVRSYGRAPRDARIWLTSWPYLYLGRNSVRRQQREYTDLIGLEDAMGHGEAKQAPDPTLSMRVVRALDEVRRVDVVSYSMLLDLLRDAFDARAWRDALGVSEASVTDRKYLAVYRYAVCFHAVLDAVTPPEAAVALRSRRFAAGEPSDQAALESSRRALGNPGLSLSAWRALYREGALRSLDLLSGPDALGTESMGQLGTAFRRVLKMD